jgi:hypothetical protein
MREEWGSAAAVTVVLVLYASTVAMPAAPQVQAAGSDDCELCSGDCDGMYNFSVEFGYPLDGVNRVRND